MKILYIGDIMGEPGTRVVNQVLPQIKQEFVIDAVIAQAENVTDGKGLSKDDFKKLRELGIDFCTGGNWSLFRPEIHDYLNDPEQPVIRPANYPEGTQGLGAKYLPTSKGKILIISLLGQIVGKDADKPVDNPLTCADAIMKANTEVEKVATIVNFHGDFSSEKRVIGYYLDGRASAVIGDHWHVPTADAQVLPKGTAHMTDVGMCGTLHSSLGVKLDIVINRWRDSHVSRNELEIGGPLQFNAALIDIDEATGLANSIQHIQRIVEQ
jgi:2',3'-cyclic-nucleotide 2'-phosphodiesterase